MILAKNADVNTQGGPYDNALQAASSRGHDKIVEMLLAEGGDYGDALLFASYEEQACIAKMLLGGIIERYEGQ